MPLMDHLRELRNRLIVSVVTLLGGMVLSLAVARPVIEGLEGMCRVCRFIFTRPTENFVAYFRVAMVLGLVLALPVILYQTVAFVLPGLHRHERRLLLAMLPGAALLFAAGLLFGYRI